MLEHEEDEDEERKVKEIPTGINLNFSNLKKSVALIGYKLNLRTQNNE